MQAFACCLDLLITLDKGNQQLMADEFGLSSGFCLSRLLSMHHNPARQADTLAAWQ